MKKYNDILFIIFIWIVFCMPVYSQVQTAEVWNLKEALNGDKTYIARDTIYLSNKFRYKTENGSAFHGKIDPTLIFTPDEDVYADAQGRVVTDSLDGCVVGNLKGIFDVNQTGAAVYTIPIDCPPGINGMEPEITLNYNSQSGDGILGMCWHMGGLSMISRTPESYYYDESRSNMIWSEKSPFSWNGQRLIKTSQVSPTQIQYRTETGEEIISAYGMTQASSYSYFIVKTKDGKTLVYGNKGADSNDYGAYHPIKTTRNYPGIYNMGWMLQSVTDPWGNYIEYEYVNTIWTPATAENGETYFGDNRVSRIIYGNESNGTKQTFGTIRFYYQNKTVAPVQYVGGIPTQNKNILSRIDVMGRGGGLQNRYKFTYEKNEPNYFLTEVIKENGKGESFHPLRFEWASMDYTLSSNYTIQYKIFESPSYKEWVGRQNYQFSIKEHVFGDFDGDGLQDLIARVIYWKGEEVKSYWVAFRKGSEHIYDYQYVAEGEWDKDYHVGFYMIDADKDGKDELYITDFDKYSCNVACYRYKNGTFIEDFYSPHLIKFNYTTVFEDRKNTYLLPVDLKGNGKYNIFLVHDNKAFYTCSSLSDVTTDIFAGKIYLTDINGNGKTELMIVKNNSANFYEYNESYKRLTTIGSLAVDEEDDIYPGDFNGDGCTDFLIRKKGETVSKVWISQGGKLVEDTAWGRIADRSPIPVRKNDDGEEEDMVPVKLLMDINQDGKTDVITGSYHKDHNGNLQFEVKIYISMGTKFVLKATRGYPGTYSLMGGGKFTDYQARDILTVSDPGKAKIEHLKISEGIRYNKIVKITNAFRDNINITYQTVHSSKNVAVNSIKNKNSGLSYDLQANMLYGMEVVKRVTGVDLSMEYSFEKPHFHWAGRGFLGFSSVTTKNNTTNQEHLAEYGLNERYHILYPLTDTIRAINGNLISTNKQHYTFRQVNAVNEEGDKRFDMRLDSLISKNVLQGTSVKTVYSDYDNSRNPCLVTTYYGDGIYTKEKYEYVSVQSHLLNQLSFKSATSMIEGRTDSIYRTEHYTYDNAGNLHSIVQDSLSTSKVSTTYSNYDQYGNPGKVVITSNGESRSQTITYTTTGRFVRSKKDDYTNQSVSYTYNEVSGLLLSKTNRIGTTSYEYDDFRRLRQTTYPDGTKETTVLRWKPATYRLTNAKYYSYSVRSGQSPVWVWYDGVGKELRKESYGFNNKKIRVDKQYSGGRLYRETEPYWEGSTSTYAATYEYDAYGRISKITTPMGNSTYSYNGLSSTVRTPSGKKETRVNNAGWVVEEKTNDKSVTFTHYTDGKVKSATPEGGTAITMKYDLLGNRTELIDPDGGTITSEYDHWGQLVKEQQAIHTTGELITTTYSYLPSGSPQAKVRNNKEKTLYEYDNLYRLKRMSVIDLSTNKPSVSQSYVYDHLDRITEVKDSVHAGKIFVTRKEYDRLGRIRKEIYPDDYYILNTYDTYGYLSRVTDSQGNHVWEGIESNEKGQLTRTQSGAKETLYGYDEKGFPVSIFTEGIVDLAYQFSISGNLESRTDNLSGHSERFVYDKLMRLTEWTVRGNATNPVTQKQYYDNIKPVITSKTGYGSAFSYGEGNNKPHALTSFLPEPGINFASERIEYTDFKKVKNISREGINLSITYGVDEQRIFSQLNKPSGIINRYYIGNYEEEITGGKTRKIHYIRGGKGLAAVYVSNSNGKDSLYYAHTDYQGSLIALSSPEGVVKEQYAYDPWGVRRNPTNWTQKDTRNTFILNRGYTLHEHLADFGLINMNGRVYDPGVGMFLSPDPYLQSPGDWLNYNRYSYGFNNPFSYIDPSGEIAWFIPVIIGAVIGAYSGGVIANDGEFNPAKWDYSSGKTWGYMAGGAFVGGLSGYAGWAIAGSGIPMANTASIAGSSFINSVGTNIYTGSQTAISISLGVASYDFTNGNFDYFGKKGNSKLKNIGYGFGALANLSDAVSLFRGGGQNIKVNSASTKDGNDWWGHSSITDENANSLLSVGPDSQVEKATSFPDTWKNSIKGAKTDWDTYLGEEGTWSVTLNNVSTTAISKYASGVTRWDLLFSSCVGHTSRALWGAGVPNIYSFHPHFLNAQLLIRELGIYSSPYLYQIPQR